MSSSPMFQIPRERLPSGWHRLTREDVAASQRGRLLIAVAEAVAEKGYPDTTIADIVRRAGVARRTFYEQFPDKESCFLAAIDAAAAVVLTRLAEQAERAPSADFRERIQSDTETYLATLAAEPSIAVAMYVEIMRAGRAALERRSANIHIFAERLRMLYNEASDQDETLPERPAEAFLIYAAGYDELIREFLLQHRAEDLPELTDRIVRATLALIGP